MPPGGIHGFRNEADEPASILMLFAPARRGSTTSRAWPSSPNCPTTNAREFFIRNDNFFV